VYLLWPRGNKVGRGDKIDWHFLFSFGLVGLVKVGSQLGKRLEHKEHPEVVAIEETDEWGADEGEEHLNGHREGHLGGRDKARRPTRMETLETSALVDLDEGLELVEDGDVEDAVEGKRPPSTLKHRDSRQRRVILGELEQSPCANLETVPDGREGLNFSKGYVGVQGDLLAEGGGDHGRKERFLGLVPHEHGDLAVIEE